MCDLLVDTRHQKVKKVLLLLRPFRLKDRKMRETFIWGIVSTLIIFVKSERDKKTTGTFQAHSN